MSSKTVKLVQTLGQLKNFNNSTPDLARASHAHVENLLDLVFDLGRSKVALDEEQNRTIGSLLSDAIRPIQKNVERAGCQYRTSLESSVLRKRSAIEFLIKDFGDLPAGQGKKLSERLASCNIKETISILDEIIDNWKDVSGSDDDEEINRDIPGIPRSHSWWFN